MSNYIPYIPSSPPPLDCDNEDEEDDDEFGTFTSAQQFKCDVQGDDSFLTYDAAVTDVSSTRPIVDSDESSQGLEELRDSGTSVQTRKEDNEKLVSKNNVEDKIGVCNNNTEKCVQGGFDVSNTYQPNVIESELTLNDVNESPNAVNEVSGGPSVNELNISDAKSRDEVEEPWAEFSSTGFETKFSAVEHSNVNIPSELVWSSDIKNQTDFQVFKKSSSISLNESNIESFEESRPVETVRDFEIRDDPDVETRGECDINNELNENEYEVVDRECRTVDSIRNGSPIINDPNSIENSESRAHANTLRNNDETFSVVSESSELTVVEIASFAATRFENSVPANIDENLIGGEEEDDDDEFDEFVSVVSSSTKPIAGGEQFRDDARDTFQSNNESVSPPLFEANFDEFGSFASVENEPDTRQPEETQDSPKTIELCFATPSLLFEEVDILPLHNLVSEKTGQDCNLWSCLSDLENTQALKYQWNNSSTSKKLLKALNIDSRNLLFGHNWNSSVPIFAANLSFNPLEPTKTSPNTESNNVTTTGGGGVKAGEPEKEPTNPVSQTQQDAIPPVHFDWMGSGLVNPLDASNNASALLDLDFFFTNYTSVVTSPLSSDIWNLENELLGTGMATQPSPGSQVEPKLSPLLEQILSCATRKPKTGLTVSIDAQNILNQLPDLSFMQARVLMFPIRSPSP